MTAAKRNELVVHETESPSLLEQMLEEDAARLVEPQTQSEPVQPEPEPQMGGELPEHFVVIANDHRHDGHITVTPIEWGTTLEKIEGHSPWLARALKAGRFLLLEHPGA